jgi:hypothetical protein
MLCPLHRTTARTENPIGYRLHGPHCLEGRNVKQCVRHHAHGNCQIAFAKVFMPWNRRVLEPSGDFSKALSRLEQKTNIHGALKKGFVAIYGFSSDEQGIRHPLLEKEAPSVDEADALFMIGACSAFLSYLINKSPASGLLA